MKVYVIGDDHRHVVQVSNAINSAGHSAIISEADPSGSGEILDDMLDNRSYDFDLTVVVTKEPVELNILLNRNSKFSSAVCMSAKEAAIARKARANVLVLDSNGIDAASVGGMVKVMLGASSQAGTQTPEPKPARSSPSVSQLLSAVSSRAGRHHKKEHEREEEKEEEAEEEPKDEGKPKGKGLMNEIKYTFGID